jgi:hypothetical protein
MSREEKTQTEIELYSLIKGERLGQKITDSDLFPEHQSRNIISEFLESIVIPKDWNYYWPILSK